MRTEDDREGLGATAGLDYLPIDRRVVLHDGAQSTEITLSILDDNEHEASESVLVHLSVNERATADAGTASDVGVGDASSMSI